MVWKGGLDESKPNLAKGGHSECICLLLRQFVVARLEAVLLGVGPDHEGEPLAKDLHGEDIAQLFFSLASQGEWVWEDRRRRR
jgi:hypothetical protein